MSPPICVFFWLILSPLLTNAQSTPAQSTPAQSTPSQSTPGADPSPSPILAPHKNESIRTIFFNSDKEGSYCGKYITLDRFTKYLLRPDYESEFRECSINFESPGIPGVCVEQEEEKTMVLDAHDQNMGLEFFELGDHGIMRYFLESFDYQADENQNTTDNEICTIGFTLQFRAEQYYKYEATDIYAIHSTLAVVHIQSPFRSGHINHMCGMRYDYRSGTGEIPDVDHVILLWRSFYTLWYGRKPASKSFNLLTPKFECTMAFRKIRSEKFESRICVYYKPMMAINCSTTWRLTLAGSLKSKVERLACSDVASVRETHVWCWPSGAIDLDLSWQLSYPTSGYVEPEEQFHLIVADFYGGAESEYREVIEGDLYRQEDYIKNRYGSPDEESSNDKEDNSYDNDAKAESESESVQNNVDDEHLFDADVFMLSLWAGVGLALVIVLATFTLCTVKAIISGRMGQEGIQEEDLSEYAKMRRLETSESKGTYV